MKKSIQVYLDAEQLKKLSILRSVLNTSRNGVIRRLIDNASESGALKKMLELSNTYVDNLSERTLRGIESTKKTK